MKILINNKKGTMKNKIDPNKDYSLHEIAQNGLMGDRTYYVCKNIITDELWKPVKDRILKARRVGEGMRTNYFIKGVNLIKFLKTN